VAIAEQAHLKLGKLVCDESEGGNREMDTTTLEHLLRHHDDFRTLKLRQAGGGDEVLGIHAVQHEPNSWSHLGEIAGGCGNVESELAELMSVVNNMDELIQAAFGAGCLERQVVLFRRKSPDVLWNT
jgi:hypothetical protein